MGGVSGGRGDLVGSGMAGLWRGSDRTRRPIRAMIPRPSRRAGSRSWLSDMPCGDIVCAWSASPPGGGRPPGSAPAGLGRTLWAPVPPRNREFVRLVAARERYLRGRSSTRPIGSCLAATRRSRPRYGRGGSAPVSDGRGSRDTVTGCTPLRVACGAWTRHNRQSRRVLRRPARGRSREGSAHGRPRTCHRRDHGHRRPARATPSSGRPDPRRPGIR